MWKKLKHKGLMGYKFRRQHGVDKYIVDFYCPSLRLAIEIDGDSHYKEGGQNYDFKRQRYIESFGIKFLRFQNNEIFTNLDGVLKTIEIYIKKRR